MASEWESPKSEKKNHAFDKEKPQFQSHTTIVYTSPYYLSALENPGTPLVAVPLKGNNYCNWARSMKMTLRTKKKLGFINGSIQKPFVASSHFDDWERADSMVIAWLINSTNPKLHGSISHATTSRDVWLDLEERFAQANASRIHQLWHKLFLIHQDQNTIVTDYYTKFKRLINELKCTCGASKELAQREEEHHVHLFLGGLDSNHYTQVKGTILNFDPLPSLQLVFNHILREESRVIAKRSKDAKSETGITFYSNKQKN
uniref:Uncharacterized protein n=1 Tax=Cajanus cajan TaxID=3821 RepID=A0A151RJD7_CAJCA|nr:hypothetical protein KK1_035944 [Cajanus cajan]